MEKFEKRDEVRLKLYRNNLTSVWLISQLAEAGIATDKSELSGALRGSRKGDKVNRILDTALTILDKYERLMSDG